MKSSQFVDALTNDIDGKDTGSSAMIEALTANKGAAPKTSGDRNDDSFGSDNEEGDNEDGTAGASKTKAPKTDAPKTGAAAAGLSAFDEMQEKLRADLTTLVEEKEAEIQEMVIVLDTLKVDIGKSEIQTESLQN